MMVKTLSRFITVAGLTLALVACSSVEGIKDQLGLKKQSPDEFRVVARAPLTLPPEFTLRPPEPGIPRPQEGTPTQAAKRAIFRADESKLGLFEQTAAPIDSRSQGEQSLLKAAGVEKIDPNIRKVVDRETHELAAESESFVETLIFWREARDTSVIVDANGETKRLRENAALGKGITSGRTPTIERKSKALLEGIF